MTFPGDVRAPALRHWNAVVGSPESPEELAEAADRLCIHLRAGLGRWIGIEGFQAVHDRAQALVHTSHPILRGLDFDGGDFLVTINAIRTHGIGPVEKGLIAWTAAVIELLGRVVGRRMAMRLLEQSITPSPRGVADSETEDPDDGEED